VENSIDEALSIVHNKCLQSTTPHYHISPRIQVDSTTE